MLLNKFLNKSIKIAGIWKKNLYTDYNLNYALKKVGNLYFLNVPVKSSILNFSKESKKSFGNKIVSFIDFVLPDIIICYLRNRWIDPESLYNLRNFNIPLVNISLDDSHKFHLVSNIAPAFDLNLTTTERAVNSYNKLGAKALYFPGGSNPDLLKVKGNVEKDIDVSFIGKKYGNRSDVYKTLIDKNFKVVFRGTGWPGGMVSFEQMRNIYSRSKIVLGFSRTSSHKNLYNLKGRDLEVTGSGAFYLCEENPELRNWFIPNKEIVFWNSIDLLTKINFYKYNEDVRNKIAEGGYLKTVNNYTWYKIFEKAIKILDGEVNE